MTVALQVPLVTPAVMVQLIPPTSEVTVPDPFPPPATVTWRTLVKVAVTLPFEMIGPVTVQVLPDATQPLQDTVELGSGVAVKVTELAP